MLLADSFLERNGTLFQILAAVLIAVVGGVGGWFLRQRNKEHKTFDYRVMSDLPILSHRPDDLKVTYLDDEVQNPRIVRVRFTNTGKQVIKEEDFLDPYVLRIKGSALLDASIANESGNNLAQCVSDGHTPEPRVQLTIRTLNPGDMFTVQMIVDGENDTDVSLVSGRVENESRPSMIEPTKAQLEEIAVKRVAGTAGLALFGGLGWVSVSTAKTVGGEKVGWGMVALGVVCIVAGLISAYNTKKALFKRLSAEGRPRTPEV